MSTSKREEKLAFVKRMSSRALQNCYVTGKSALVSNNCLSIPWKVKLLFRLLRMVCNCTKLSLMKSVFEIPLAVVKYIELFLSLIYL